VLVLAPPRQEREATLTLLYDYLDEYSDASLSVRFRHGQPAVVSSSVTNRAVPELTWRPDQPSSAASLPNFIRQLSSVGPCPGYVRRSSGNSPQSGQACDSSSSTMHAHSEKCKGVVALGDSKLEPCIMCRLERAAVSKSAARKSSKVAGDQSPTNPSSHHRLDLLSREQLTRRYQKTRVLLRLTERKLARATATSADEMVAVNDDALLQVRILTTARYA